MKTSRLLTVALLSIAIIGCATRQPAKSVDEVISDAVRNQPEAPMETSPEAMTAEDYISLASLSEGREREQALLKAAELLVERGDLRLARSQLQNLDAENIARNRQVQINLLAARIALANDNPRQAMELLPQKEELDLPQFIEARRLLADAYLALNYPMQAVRTRVDLDRYLETPAEKQENHEAIWAALLRVPPVSLNATEEDSRIVQGWVELARIMRNAQKGVTRMQEDILDWGTRYPEHPVSNAFIDRLFDSYLAGYQPVESVAVMLPMSGPYQAVSSAIQGGIISAHYEEENPEKPALRFYDTAIGSNQFNDLYAQAVMDGAGYVIGPLDKITINKLAQQQDHALPTLTLNYAGNPASRANNLYQFGLLPEDEARQVAELAIRDNRLRAAVLVPDSEWGRRLLYAFEKRFEELGGAVLASEQYATDLDDYATPLRRLFNLDESRRRHRDLERLLGTSLEFMPHRRQDIDMVFMVATNRAARGIMPALKFHHAGDLPVYATSHVYSGHPDPKSDRDLDGLVFCDLPWNLTADGPLKQDFEQYYKDLKSYTRLFALGVDAYRLIRNLGYIESSPSARFNGETGNISMDENQRLHRELLWARFRDGMPVYFDITLPPEDNDAEPAGATADAT